MKRKLDLLENTSDFWVSDSSVKQDLTGARILFSVLSGLIRDRMGHL